jgi:hypothetical protein
LDAAICFNCQLYIPPEEGVDWTVHPKRQFDSLGRVYHAGCAFLYETIAVKFVRPTDLRNRIGMFMLEEYSLHIGSKVDAGKVQDMIEKFASRELAAQPTPGWISVKDRLPKTGDTVLAININVEYGSDLIEIVNRNYLGAGNNADMEDFVGRGYTHWMLEPVRPLSNPPKRRMREN